ncbi:MAG: DUF1549 domain-containing protein [Verrucomicrobiales bacterium]|nr:DUF1549 domain-containing protein [Verrucomicrobiales bacterium]MCP5557865.1 DUF1549 domain-containing protein [Verrucomicrobiaceae bacterium]
MKSMKTLLTGLCLAALGLSSAFAEVRTWTDVQGRQVSATFVNIEGEDIVLQTADGQTHRFALTRLSAEDQAFAKAQKPAPATADAVPDAALSGFTYAKSAAGQTALGLDKLVAAGIIKHANPARAKEGLPPIKGFNAVMNDEQFVRRVYLDVIGRIPSYDETLAFFQNKAPDKRAKLIDQLLDSEGYNSHMFNYFAEMLRVKHRLDQANVRADDYVNWLKEQISKNRPWNEMVSDMLTAEGKMWHNGAAGYLLRDAGMQLDNLANTLTVFLGTDVACAQCHDHPFADWTQKQFYELASFFGATSTTYRRGGGGMMGGNADLMDQVYAMAEKGGADLRRIRNGLNNFVGANRYNIADTDKNMTVLPHDYKYKDGKPGDEVAPKFVMWSPQDKSNPAYKQNKKSEEKLRQSFAAWLTHPENPRFAMTIANRLWKRAFGVGVAEPVTNIDDPEKASNPELLKALAQVMKSVKFDMKEFQRVIFNTHAYQSEACTEEIPMGAPYYFQGPQLRRMTAEQAWDSYMTLVLGQPEEYKAPLSDLYGKSIDLDLTNPKLDAMTVLMKYSAFQKIEKKVAALTGGGLDMAGGDMMMSGGDDKPSAADTAAASVGANGKQVLSYGGNRLLRASELPQPERGGHFLAEFGQSPRTLIDGGSRVGNVPQVLAMMNGGAQQMLTERSSLIFRAIDAAKDPAAKVDTVFLAIMNRLPTLQEKDIAKREITAHGDEGYASMIWALINTREFIFVQ